jgi:hypothetical protein
MAVVMQASLIHLRDELYLTAAGLSLSLISRDQPCQLAVNLSTFLISRNQLCLLALHLFSGSLSAFVHALHFLCFSLYPLAVHSGLLFLTQRLLGTVDFVWGERYVLLHGHSFRISLSRRLSYLLSG